MQELSFKNTFITVSVIFVFSMLVGCGKKKSSDIKSPPKKELLIYCGMTMIQPMRKIADIIEKEQNCKIIITKGASGHLLKSIKTNKCGDIYFPGSESYIKTAITDRLICKENTAYAGDNQLAIIVKKNNPLKIAADFANLANKQYRVVLGAPDCGSVGRATKKILEENGIEKSVYDNVIFFTMDSKDLTDAIIMDKADVTINWLATSVWKHNSPHITAIEIDEKSAPKKKLVLGILEYSKFPETAKKLLKLAGSERGKKIFDQYGF